MLELRLDIEAPALDDAGKIATLTAGLRRELGELPIEKIEAVADGEAPEGARSHAEVISWSALALTLAKPALADVFRLAQSWVKRQPAKPKVTITVGKAKIVIEGEPTPEMEGLVKEFLAAIEKDEEPKPTRKKAKS
jgi:hypothetical protein